MMIRNHTIVGLNIKDVFMGNVRPFERQVDRSRTCKYEDGQDIGRREIFNGEINKHSLNIVPLLNDNTRLTMIEGQEEVNK